MKSKLFEEVKDILEYETEDLSYEELIEYAKNPLNYSCANGCITSLIYYKDTYSFADRHYDEIIELFKEYEICEMNKNQQAWIAFELLAPQALEELIQERKEKELDDEEEIEYG